MKLFIIALVLLVLPICGQAQVLPPFSKVEGAIAVFLSEVHGHEGVGGFERRRNMFDVINDPMRPVLDVRGAKELMGRHNPYTLMGYPARLTTRKNSYFLGSRAQKALGLEAHFNIGPGAYMGKIVLAHEIGHTFGLNEVEADVFAAAYSQHDVWDLAEYYLLHPGGWGEEAGGDYLPAAARLQLIAGAL
jgi:hypothetical protein